MRININANSVSAFFLALIFLLLLLANQIPSKESLVPLEGSQPGFARLIRGGFPGSRQIEFDFDRKASRCV